MLLAMLITISLLYTGGSVPYQEDVNDALAVVTSMIDRNANNSEGTDLPFIGGLIRLAFHDCIGPGGLERSTSDINTTSYRFTRRKDFKLGRQSCPSSPLEDKTNEIANSLWNIDDVLKFFRSNFSFTDQQIVALMGAHSLGRARIENSGIEGRWVNSPNRRKGELLPGSVLTNEYYKKFISQSKWYQKMKTFHSLTKTQWEITNKTIDSVSLRGKPNQPIMLMNSDIALVWNFTLKNQSTGAIETNKHKGGCNVDKRSPSRCSSSSTLKMVEFYAKDENRDIWVADFSEVFLHLTERNYVGRKDLTKYSELKLKAKPKKQKLNRNDYLYLIGGPIRGF